MIKKIKRNLKWYIDFWKNPSKIENFKSFSLSRKIGFIYLTLSILYIPYFFLTDKEQSKSNNYSYRYQGPKINSNTDLQNHLTSNVFYSSKTKYNTDVNDYRNYGSITGHDNYYKYQFYNDGTYKVWKGNTKDTKEYVYRRSGKWKVFSDYDRYENYDGYIEMYPNDQSIKRKGTYYDGGLHINYSRSDGIRTGTSEIISPKEEYKKEFPNSTHTKWMNKYGW